MGKASTKKRVQRGSGAKKLAMRGKRRPYGFYALIGVLVVAGTGGIILAKGGSSSADGERPALYDHWHSAYAVDICGTIQPNMAQPANLIGIHTHTDYTEPSKVKITDQGAITIAFLAEGATDIPKPASIANLSNPNAGEGASNMPTTPTS